MLGALTNMATGSPLLTSLSGSGQLGAVGDLSSLNNMISNFSQFTQNNTVTVSDSQSTIEDKLRALGIELPEGIDEAAYNEAMDNLSAMEERLEEENTNYVESQDKEVEYQKAKYFTTHKYEWYTDENGDPDFEKGPKGVVECADGENAVDKLNRERYEQLQTEKLKDQQLDLKYSEVNAEKFPATAKVKGLMDDYDAMQEFLAQDNGYIKYANLIRDAQAEEQNLLVDNKTEIYNSYLPDELKHFAAEYNANCKNQYQTSRDTIDNSEDLRIVDEYQQVISEYSKKIRDNIVAGTTVDLSQYETTYE